MVLYYYNYQSSKHKREQYSRQCFFVFPLAFTLKFQGQPKTLQTEQVNEKEIKHALQQVSF